MEIYDFINSKDIKAHWENINYVPTALESAWLVWQSKNHTLEEKHKAWKEIIVAMPDCAFDSHGIYDEANIDSVHTFLSEYMDVENQLLEQFFKNESNAVYTYKFWSDEEKDWVGENGALYADFEEAKAEFMDDADLDPAFAQFSKRYIGAEDRRIHIRMRPDGTILNIAEDRFICDEQEHNIFYDVFFGMELAFKNKTKDVKWTEQEIWDKAYKRIFELYGDMPDFRIVSRFYSEKQAFTQYEVGKYFYDLAKLRCEAEDAGERLIVKNTVASCLVAYLLGTTDENPLPAHYYCPKCKTVAWMEGKCVFDLRDRTCACGEKMKADGFDIPFETYLPYAKKLKTADTVPENYQQLFDSILSHFQKSLLGTVNICKQLEKATGVCMDSIDLNNREVKCRLLTGNFENLAGVGGEKAIKQMIELAHPVTYNELLKLIGLAHGTCTWRHNAEHLLADGVCSLYDIPATRDDVFMTIREAMRDCYFYDMGFAFDVANKAQHGYYREHGMDHYTNSTLQMLGLDNWFGSYIRATHYMSTKALAVLELKYSIILNWYQVYYPKEYQRIVAEYNS